MTRDERLRAVAELVSSAGASVSVLESTFSSLIAVLEERNRYHKALVSIADEESGVWGKWAREALDG